MAKLTNFSRENIVETLKSELTQDELDYLVGLAALGSEWSCWIKFCEFYFSGHPGPDSLVVIVNDYADQPIYRCYRIRLQELERQPLDL